MSRCVYGHRLNRGWLGHMAWRWLIYDYRANLEREFWGHDSEQQPPWPTVLA